MGEAIRKLVKKYAEKLKDNRIYFNPDIPPQKLAKAIQTYAPAVPEEDVLILIDDTVTGNGKKGMLLTPVSIHAKSQMEDPKVMALEDIQSAVIKKGLLGALLINGKKFFEINMPEKKAMQKFALMLLDLAHHSRKGGADAQPQPESVPADPVPAQRYQLWLTGRLMEGKSLAGVKQQIADRFRLHTETVDRLFERAPVVVKKDVDSETARKFQTIFHQAGAECRIGSEKDESRREAPAETSESSSNKFVAGSLLPQTQHNLSLQTRPGYTGPVLTVKAINRELVKINKQQFQHTVLKFSGLLPRVYADKIRKFCRIPEKEKVLGVIHKIEYRLIFAITSHRVYWNHGGTCYVISFEDFGKLDIVAENSQSISIGPDKGIGITKQLDFLVIRDILVAFQYFVKTGKHIPEDQLIFKPEVCPRCGSPQLFITKKNKMNWKAGAIAGFFGGPVFGAAAASSMGELIDVKQCNRCFHTEKVDLSHGSER